LVAESLTNEHERAVRDVDAFARRYCQGYS
jgi:hypothetical protein